MPEILLFDIFEPRIGNGMSTGGVHTSPFNIFFKNVLPQENFEKYTQKKAFPAISDIFFSFPLHSFA